MSKEKFIGNEILDAIKTSLEVSKQMDNISNREDSSPFKYICRKIQMKKGVISKLEILASYMEEVERDLI